MRKWIVVLSVPLLALTSCSTDKLGSAKNVKQIDVKVGEGIVKVGEDPALADINRSAIQWVLEFGTVAAGYKFPAEGIVFDPNPVAVPVGCVKGDPVRAFHNCRPHSQGTVFQCDRRPNGFEPGACYKYTVTLTGVSGNPPPLDPWFKNQ